MINAVIGQLVYAGAQTVIILGGNVEYEFVVSSQTATKLSSLHGAERSNVRFLRRGREKTLSGVDKGQWNRA